MKKLNKLLFVLIIFFLLITICNVVLAINLSDYEPSHVSASDAKPLTDKVGVILGAVRNISAVAAVIVIMIIGLKYIMGSVEEKANYKATMMPYIIGCVMAVAGTTIVSFIYDSLN